MIAKEKALWNTYVHLQMHESKNVGFLMLCIFNREKFSRGSRSYLVVTAESIVDLKKSFVTNGFIHFLVNENGFIMGS